MKRHHTCLRMDGYRYVVAGQRVRMRVEDGPKGLRAVEVWPL